MDKDNFPVIKKGTIIIVSIIALILLILGGVLGLWSADDLQKELGEQFNKEQLAIAGHAAGLIERELNFLKKEIALLVKEISTEPFDPGIQNESVQKSLSRVLESGVWKIEIIDILSGKTDIFMPYKHWIKKDPLDIKPCELPLVSELCDKTVWVSRPQVKPFGISLILCKPLAGDPPRLLIFNINVSWFLAPFLRNIRSGKTGYAWVIDGHEKFLFHPDAAFVGKSAFTAREEKYPDFSYEKINFIQKEKMLKGMKGTGWYFSAWHRGTTGKIKKLIAYYPIVISDNPPQKWSVAVAAPVAEIEAAVKKGYLRQFLLQGLVIMIVVLGASTILFFEMRWSRLLEEKVDKRTEALKRSEEKYRSLVESAEDFIFTVDSEGIFQSMNSFTANFFGGRAEEFLGKGLSGLFPEEIAEKQLKLIGLVYTFGKSVRDEFEIPMGEYQVWISANFMPLKNEEGTVSSVLCIARDITENKSLEKQLVNTEKLASMGTLAAGVAHEINNPLGVILGFCDLLARKTEKGSQEFEDLKTIERQGLHCKEVVENLLSFARLGEGVSEYSDLNSCLQEIVNVSKHTLDMNDIELVMEIRKNIPLVKGDSRHLQQVFLNLINNAVAAMKNGGTLTICTGLDKERKKAFVQFKDEGTGIKAEDLDHIFDPFFTTKPEGEGTGLGLFVSYGIVSRYGGSMDCVSFTSDSQGKYKGTTFTVKLPAKMRE